MLDREDMMLILLSQKGFTLAETAIVLIIVGLLMGGLLQGQTLTQNARVIAEVSQIQAISNADRNFKTMFSLPPGDLPNAGSRFPGCPGVGGVNCNPFMCAPEPCAGGGDGIIGNPLWASQGFNPWLAPGYGTTTTGTITTNVDDERYLFWAHLSLTNLYNGVNINALASPTPYSCGVTHPLVKLGGCLQVGYNNGYVSPGNSVMLPGTGLSGTILVHETNNELTNPLSVTVGGNVLTPYQAWQVDIKMDDGRPGSGYVQAFGLQTSCFDTVTGNDMAAAPGYLQTVTTPDCGLMFRISG